MPDLNAPEPSEEIIFSVPHDDTLAHQRLNVEQMLSLVASILPFEACLFHQVMPLSIESGHLNLGMVDPSDRVALDYVRQQVSYINYSVIPWPVPADWHRQTLSKYLSHTAKAKPAKNLASTGPVPAWPSTAPSDTATLVVDSPPEIPNLSPSAPSTDPPASPSAVPPSAPPLQIDLNTPKDVNDQDPNPASLAPKALMQLLVQQVLSEGIGRLYFERQTHSGRVLRSQDGILQSAINDLSLELFQGVINELKRLTHLPLLPITTTRQVEVERLYRQERVLLRLRIIAGQYGEEATLQVLRGAALKFHQQQQIEQLGRDALGIAQTLQQRIHAIGARAQTNLTLDQSPSATLLAVSSMLKAMESQINQIIQTQDHPAQNPTQKP
ncbi:MAG: hypothetical protein VKI82_13250 [Leptolyngbya sp.]|nr:hypothetical protein [Leptolyngbya sp.]